MSISNFDFPKVTLRQIFQQEAPGAVRAMGVACVGPVYKYNSPDMTELSDLSWNTARTTVTAKLPDATFTPDYTAFKLSVSGGVWSYYKYAAGDATLADNVLTFGASLVNPTVQRGRELVSGDYVLLEFTVDGSSDFELREVESVGYVTAADGTVDKSKGRNKVTLGAYDYIAKKISTKSSGPAGVSLCFVSDWSGTVTVTANTDRAGYVDIANAQFDKAEADLLDESDSTVNTMLVAMNAEQGGSAYVRYRSGTPLTGNKSFGTVSTLADVNEVLGPASTDNPTALACHFAIAAGGGTVYYKGVASAADSPVAYTDALEYLDRYNDIYSIVPCTEDEDCIQACAAYVTSVSENIDSKMRRTLWYGVSFDGADDATAADVIEQIVGKNYTHSYRAQCVWADGASFDNQSLEGHNYALAAAAAGMRAGQPVHRPLSNLGYSFFSVSETHALSRSQMKRIGSNGIWIIANNEDGAPINMRQVTSAAADSLNLDEESIVANADDVALSVARVGSNMVGCSNISPLLLSTLEDTLRTRLDFKTVGRDGALIGPQLLSWEFVRTPYQDPVNRDHVLAEFSITPPRPFNQFHMTLVVL